MEVQISIAIVDTDREYLERLAEGLQQYDELTVYAYTGSSRFQAAMETEKFDIVLFSPEAVDDRVLFSNDCLPICLYSEEARNRELYTDFVKILKYQRISNIYKEVMREYADRAGYSAEFCHSGNAGLIAVYSPAGGSGKTATALAIAGRLAEAGRRPLYISMEQLNSASLFYPRQEEGITVLLQSIGKENVNFELKAKGIVKRGMNGSFYVEGFDRIVDYDAVNEDEMEDMLGKLMRCSICDVIVVDMESRLDLIGRVVLELANQIVIVEKPGELPAMKMSLFAKQALVNKYKKKMVKICNFAENNSVYCQEPDIPVIGMVHHYGNLPLQSLLKAMSSGNEIAADRLFQSVQGE